MDTHTATHSSKRAAAAPDSQLGRRLKRLRLSAGLTQTELAGERCSKEYVSQIELGKTRPTRETIAWLATRLGVDPEDLANGVATDLDRQAEAALAVGDTYLQKQHYREALEEYVKARKLVKGANLPELEVRALLGEAESRAVQGEVKVGLALADEARKIVERVENESRFTDLDLAEVLHYMGVCRYKLGKVTTALGLFDEALRLVARQEQTDARDKRAQTPRQVLTIRILHYRSRCYRQRRLYDAAQGDIDQALDLAEQIQDERRLGDLYFQASLIAYKDGRWARARSLAQQAKECLERASREGDIGKLLNNLGGLNLMLGNKDVAEKYLTEAFAKALEVDDKADAGQAVSSLARVALERENFAKAVEHANTALKLLEGRKDYLLEIGMAGVTLGRALLSLDELALAEQAFTKAAEAFEENESKSHRALGRMARAELAERRGDLESAVGLYKQAAKELQDEQF